MQAHITGAAALGDGASADMLAMHGQSVVTTRQGRGRQAHRGGEGEGEGEGYGKKAMGLRELVLDAIAAIRRAAK